MSEAVTRNRFKDRKPQDAKAVSAKTRNVTAAASKKHPPTSGGNK